jgi:hypothetical protein
MKSYERTSFGISTDYFWYDKNVEQSAEMIVRLYGNTDNENGKTFS